MPFIYSFRADATYCTIFKFLTGFLNSKLNTAIRNGQFLVVQEVIVIDPALNQRLLVFIVGESRPSGKQALVWLKAELL